MSASIHEIHPRQLRAPCLDRLSPRSVSIIYAHNCGITCPPYILQESAVRVTYAASRASASHGTFAVHDFPLLRRSPSCPLLKPYRRSLAPPSPHSSSKEMELIDSPSYSCYCLQALLPPIGDCPSPSLSITSSSISSTMGRPPTIGFARLCSLTCRVGEFSSNPNPVCRLLSTLPSHSTI